MACRVKFVKRNTVTFPSLEFREVTLRSDFENLRKIEMHFQRKLFLKWLASLPCGEIALYFKLPLLPSKMGAFTARDSRKNEGKLICWLLTHKWNNNITYISKSTFNKIFLSWNTYIYTLSFSLSFLFYEFILQIINYVPHIDTHI